MASSLNGTGVTFNDGTTLQSGNIPAANLGSGTANSTTFLRGDRTFATPPSQAPTTAQVLAATAGAAARGLGSYGFCCGGASSSGLNLSAGATRAGTSLFYTNSSGGGNATEVVNVGTWRLLGRVTNNLTGAVWLRIS